MSVRRWLRPFLVGAASLFDLSGAATYRAMRDALPDPSDAQAIRGYFEEAGRLISGVMRDFETVPDSQVDSLGLAHDARGAWPRVDNADMTR